MGKKLDKFVLLMWKNWILQIRSPKQTFIEILAPVVFTILLVVIRSLVDPEKFDAVTYKPFNPIATSQNWTILASASTNTTNASSPIHLIYSPNENLVIDEVMTKISGLLKIDITGFPNAKAMETYFLANNRTFAGMQFDDSLGGKNDIPDDLEITLRFPDEPRFPNLFLGRNSWYTNSLYPVYQVPGPRAPKNYTGASPGYYVEGFLTIQTIFSYALTYRHENITSLEDFLRLNAPIIQMQRFPYGPWTDDPLLQALESFVGLVIMLSFVYTCISTVRVITTEKEKQLKEAMKIMGLPNWLHWTAWFIKTFIFLFVSIVLIIVLLKVSWYPTTNFSLFTFASPTVMLVFFILYISATITFCFAISVFFSNANTASTVAGLLWFLSYSPYLFLQKQYDMLSLSSKLAASLGSNSAMAYGLQVMLMYEGTNEGINWSNIFTPVTSDDTLTLGYIMMMMIIDCFIYLLVAIYVEGVLPGEYGVPLPWYFPFTYNYWFGRPFSITTVTDSELIRNKNEFFESEPTRLNPGIQISNLRKVFGNKSAVRNLSLNMYDNQITVLLGHNGAGKTTTMSMLTGMVPPTSGTAIVCGHDIRTNMEAVRASLGLCPQHNILFDDLTVKEHLYFFSKLKGLKNDEIEREVNSYVDLLELGPKANAKSATLSGGMKRKLCVGISLCGHSKVVMLDEPTAGMDPAARRALWDLLQKQKEGRTILLSTHFMDEADLLGDRIAIMAGGELQCCGTSFFLKKKYGAGYHLIMEMAPGCNPVHVTELLQKYIPNIQIESNIGSELSYQLTEDQSGQFEEMLHDLEVSSERLQIRSYGVSLTTLEEVFMKFGADHGQEEVYASQNLETGRYGDFWAKIKAKFTKSATHPIVHDVKIGLENMAPYTGWKLVANQFKAMFLKRSLSILRSLRLQFIQNLLPVSFLIIAIVVTRHNNRTGDMPKLAIKLDAYQQPITVISTSSNSYTDSYIRNVGRIERVANITQMMLDLTTISPSTANKQYVVGASFDRFLFIYDRITAWFNNNPYHTPPLALGLVLNAIYNKITGKEIRFANHPFPVSSASKVSRLIQGSSMGFQIAFNIAFSMAFVSSFYILFYVRERVCKSKHLQFVSGVKIFVFWITAFICDICTYLVTIIALLLTLLVFQEDGFRTSEDLSRVFFILCRFGISFIPMLYVASYFFEVPSTGFTRMTLFGVFTGVGAFLTTQVLRTPSIELEYVADGLHWAFLLFPHYALASSVQNSYLTYSFNKICHMVVEECVNFRRGNESTCWDAACKAQSLKKACCSQTADYYKWEMPGNGKNVLYSFITSIILCTAVLLLEYKFNLRKPKLGPEEIVNEDTDVSDEKHKIRSTPLSQLQQTYTLILKDVTKYYDNFLAVNGLCLGVKQYECFGLLGVNGAGKTSTFKMMTGDVPISYGDAWIGKNSIRSDLEQVQKAIGYCPQFDALLVDLTAFETLIMFGLLRGIPYNECQFMARKLAHDFDFKRHLDKQIRALSGGNKRKVSTAISLIGDPPVVYLDEPTTGMDPATKRHLWNAICKVRDAGKCVVLTSHSMEECEALCTRLAIMVNGNFKCIGSTQHLKNKFAEGYTLTIKLRKCGEDDDGDVERIREFVMAKFPTAMLREKHQELMTYYIEDKSIPWSKMFGILEGSKGELNIEDYSLGQSSLEQVFLLFTKLQR